MNEKMKEERRKHNQAHKKERQGRHPHHEEDTESYYHGDYYYLDFHWGMLCRLSFCVSLSPCLFPLVSFSFLLLTSLSLSLSSSSWEENEEKGFGSFSFFVRTVPSLYVCLSFFLSLFFSLSRPHPFHSSFTPSPSCDEWAAIFICHRNRRENWTDLSSLSLSLVSHIQSSSIASSSSCLLLLVVAAFTQDVLIGKELLLKGASGETDKHKTNVHQHRPLLLTLLFCLMERRRNISFLMFEVHALCKSVTFSRRRKRVSTETSCHTLNAMWGETRITAGIWTLHMRFSTTSKQTAKTPKIY